MAGHALLLLLGQQPPDEVLALLAHVLERLRVELPVAVLHVLQRGHVVGAGEGRQACRDFIICYLILLKLLEVLIQGDPSGRLNLPLT